jgi:hypothetical protein
VTIGFNICSSNSRTIFNSFHIGENYESYCYETESVKKASIVSFYFTLLFATIENLESAIYVQNTTYLNLYTTYVSQLPTIAHKLAQANDLAMCIFLSTLPSKKESKAPILLYLLCNGITIISGIRGTIVNCILFVLLYCYFRQGLSNKMGNDGQWVTRRLKIFILVAAPLCIVLLSIYNTLRDGVIPSWNGFFEEILTFFKDQGGSANIIGYTELYKDYLPETNTSYFFGPLISLFKYGSIGSIFSGLTEIKNNTVEMALYGNNLGATITYLYNPNGWLNG